MTIPTLQTNFEKQRYETALKKSVSELQTAIKTTMLAMGCYDLKCTGYFNDPGGGDWTTINTNVQTFVNELVDNNIKAIVKNCGINQTPCFAPLYYKGYKKSSTMGTTNTLDDPPGDFSSTGARFGILLADGISASFAPDLSGIVSNSGLLLTLYIDVNSIEKPNVLGRDTFYFSVRNDGSLIPYASKQYAVAKGQPTLLYWRIGATGTGYCTNTNDSGINCGARVQEEGWKINYNW